MVKTVQLLGFLFLWVNNLLLLHGWKQDPAKTSLQPFWQQVGTLYMRHWQCFCNRKSPKLPLLQSVWVQVVLLTSNVCIPSVTWFWILENFVQVCIPIELRVIFDKILKWLHYRWKSICPGNLVHKPNHDLAPVPYSLFWFWGGRLLERGVK